MNHLIVALQSNTLPVTYWVIVVVWALALAAQLALLRYDAAGVRPSARQVAGPVIMGTMIFSVSYLGSQQVKAFFAGGWSFTALVSLACSVYWHSRAAKGKVVLPRQRLQVLLVATCVLTILGIALTQLALLGASLFIAATIIGYFRKQKMPSQNA